MTNLIYLPRTPTKTQQIFELSCPFDNPFQGKASRYLFVCSAGLLRAPTAAAVATSLGYNARSCGSSPYALVPISVNLIEWAHRIFFVNEENYLAALDTFVGMPEYEEMLLNKSTCWDIEDIHDYGAYSLKKQVVELLS